MNTKAKKQKRIRRHIRIRAKIKGTALRPRLSVFRSHKDLLLQLIDDTAGRTIVSASGRDIAKKERQGRVALATLLGALIAHKAQEKNITQAVFDRGGYRYHGAVRAVAEAVRAGGLNV